MRSKLRKLLRDLENESGFRNEYTECSEIDNQSYEIKENIDFPNFRLIGKKYNEKYPTRSPGGLILYSDTAIRAELVRMESDGLILIGVQDYVRQARPCSSSIGDKIVNTKTKTEKIILSTQGKSSIRYFFNKITREPISFIFSFLAISISIIGLHLPWSLNTTDLPFQEVGKVRLGVEGRELKLLSVDTKGQLGKLFLFEDDDKSVLTSLSIENLNIESPNFRIVSGNKRDWLVVTTIENSGTGYMKKIDTWYIANPYFKGDPIVLSYPSSGHITNWTGLPDQKLTVNVSNISGDDNSIDVLFSIEKCVTTSDCSIDTKKAHYVWDGNSGKFVLDKEKSDVTSKQITDLLTIS